jgi:hypothetical protein
MLWAYDAGHAREIEAHLESCAVCAEQLYVGHYIRDYRTMDTMQEVEVRADK